MGTYFYPVFERELPGGKGVKGRDGSLVSGKPLAEAVYRWEIPALSVLADLCSSDPHDDAHALGLHLPDEEDPDPEYQPAPADFPFLPENWFDPAQGLRGVRGALRSLTTANLPPSARWSKEDVKRELEAVEAVLAHAEKLGVRFHFELDA